MNESPESETAPRLYKSAIQNQKVRVVLPKLTNIVQVDATSSTLEAAGLLWKNSLLAVPVWDNVEKKYLGFFDMRDILRVILKVQETTTTLAEQKGNEDENEGDDDDDYDEFLAKTLQELTLSENDPSLYTLATRRPIYTCRSDDSLEALCQLLSQPDCRRVLICDTPGERCVNMVSRSTVIKYLAEHGSGLTGTLDQSGLDFRKDVVSVTDTVTAKAAFELILDRKLYGIAVVDEDGGLLGNTSARDIKLVALYKGCNAMDMDILSYLASVRQEDSVDNGKKAKYPACNVRESSTVGHVLSLLAKTGYHRVFVTNTYVEPVGVISEQDILHFVLTKGKVLVPDDMPGLAK